MTDICSARSFDDLKKSGQLGKAQTMYLFVFVRAFIASGDEGIMTHREADKAVYDAFGRTMPARNTRIQELEVLGFLERRGTVKDSLTGKLVNRYIWTGRTTPFEYKMEWMPCSHCAGKGGKLKRVYQPVPVTIPTDFFGGNERVAI